MSFCVLRIYAFHTEEYKNTEEKIKERYKTNKKQQVMKKNKK